MDFNERLRIELGTFVYGRTSWLKYQDKMDTFFDKQEVFCETRKRDICVSMIGEQTLRILKSLLLPQTVRDVEYSTVVTKLESHFYPKMGHEHYMFKFTHRKQKKRESFFNYVVALRKLLVNCRGNLEDCLRKQILVGLNINELKNQLLEIRNITLTKIFELGLAHDYKISVKIPLSPRNHKARINREKRCFRCNESILRKHKNISCPFDWAVCEHCKVKGHISTACKYKDLSCYFCRVKGHISRICPHRLNGNVNHSL